jgi:hypothetical protein
MTLPRRVYAARGRGVGEVFAFDARATAGLE